MQRIRSATPATARWQERGDNSFLFPPLRIFFASAGKYLPEFLPDFAQQNRAMAVDIFLRTIRPLGFSLAIVAELPEMPRVEMTIIRNSNPPVPGHTASLTVSLHPGQDAAVFEMGGIVSEAV